MTKTLSLVGHHQVDHVWPQIVKMLEKGIERQGVSMMPGDYHTKVRKGDAFLFVWLANDRIVGVVICDFVLTLAGPCGQILALCSEAKMEWPDDVEPLLEFMRDNGAIQVICEGRPGFGRIFKKAKVKRHVYEMEL